MRLITYTPATRCSSPSLLAANPFAMLEAEMSRILGTNTQNGFSEAATEGSWIPVSLHEEANSYLLHAELPGVRKEDIGIELLDGQLKLSATRRWKAGETEHKQNYSRSITLGEDVEAEKISATHENGLLTVTLPKREQPKPRKISVG